MSINFRFGQLFHFVAKVNSYDYFIDCFFFLITLLCSHAIDFLRIENYNGTLHPQKNDCITRKIQVNLGNDESLLSECCLYHFRHQSLKFYYRRPNDVSKIHFSLHPFLLA